MMLSCDAACRYSLPERQKTIRSMQLQQPQQPQQEGEEGSQFPVMEEEVFVYKGLLLRIAQDIKWPARLLKQQQQQQQGGGSPLHLSGSDGTGSGPQAQEEEGSDSILTDPDLTQRKIAGHELRGLRAFACATVNAHTAHMRHMQVRGGGGEREGGKGRKDCGGV